MRSSTLVLAFLLAGCGKSFQEADAIYKDEVAKLQALEAERDAAYVKLSIRNRIEHADAIEARKSAAIVKWNSENPIDYSENEAFESSLKQFDQKHDVKMGSNGAYGATPEILNERRKMVMGFQKRLSDAMDDREQRRNSFIHAFSESRQSEQQRTQEEEAAWKQVEREFGERIESQQAKVKAAYEAKEAAK